MLVRVTLVPCLFNTPIGTYLYRAASATFYIDRLNTMHGVCANVAYTELIFYLVFVYFVCLVENGSS